MRKLPLQQKKAMYKKVPGLLYSFLILILCFASFNSQAYAFSYSYFSSKENPPKVDGLPLVSHASIDIEGRLADIHIALPRQDPELYRKHLWSLLSVHSEARGSLTCVIERYELTSGNKRFDVVEKVRENAESRTILNWNQIERKVWPSGSKSAYFIIKGFSTWDKVIHVDVQVRIKNGDEEEVIQQKFLIYKGKYHIGFLGLLIGR